ncbi:MAG: hypothetical protein ACTSR8_04875 [Promethearchaeota archaeon]
MKCDLCGKEHGSTPSVFNKWHRCRKCDTIYCDICGKKKLKSIGFLTREKICKKCGVKTRLI